MNGLLLCEVTARTPDAVHKYVGLFPNTTRASVDAYERFGFQAAVTVKAIRREQPRNIFVPRPSHSPDFPPSAA